MLLIHRTSVCISLYYVEVTFTYLFSIKRVVIKCQTLGDQGASDCLDVVIVSYLLSKELVICSV